MTVSNVEIQRHRVLLIPSAYEAEWSIRTNEILASQFISHYELVSYGSWDGYHVSQYRITAEAASWLNTHSSEVDAVFYVNIYKDFSYHLLMRHPGMVFLGLVHGVSSDALEPGSGPIPLGFERAISASAILCCTSQHLLSKLRKCGMESPSIRVTGLPLDTVQFSEHRRDTSLCVYNHRLVEEKGVSEFADLWTHVTSHAPEARCVVTWPSATKQGQRHLERMSQLPGVTLAGTLPRDEYYQLLTTASAGFSLSEYENFGTSYCYALLQGVCYFVPNRLAYRETAPPEQRYSTHEDLVEKLIRAFQDKQWRAWLVESGQAYLIRKYSVDSFLRKCGIV